MLWFEGDLSTDVKDRLVYLIMTGEDIPSGVRYLGTATFGQGGWIVVHCYVG